MIGFAVHALAAGLLDSGAGLRTLRVIPTRIDLNKASVVDLQALPGVGPVRAEAIVLHRIRHGPFRRRDGLLQVEGIGLGTLQALEPHLVPLPADAAPEAR